MTPAPGPSLYKAGVLYLEPDLHTNTNTTGEGGGGGGVHDLLPAAIASNIIIFPHFDVPLRFVLRKREIEPLESHQ